MVHRIDKEEALIALAENRRRLGTSGGECVMCALAEGRSHPSPVWETPDALVLLDRFGARRGHLMIVLREHVEDVTDVGRERYLRVQELTFDACRSVERALSPTRTFVASLGAPRAVPMSFPHFHVHVIPLYESDERTRPARVFSWTDGVVVYDDEEAEALAQELRASWPARAGALRAVAGGQA